MLPLNTLHDTTSSGTARTVQNASWLSFLLGLLVVAVANLSATFGGRKPQSILPSQNLRTAMNIGTGLMYLALFLLPAVPLLYHGEKKDINSWDYASSGMQWLSYILLPIGLSLWDKPNQAKTGAVTLGASVVALLGSWLLAQQARKKRKASQPSTMMVMLM